MIPSFESRGHFFLNDLVDSDSFLRFYLHDKLKKSHLISVNLWDFGRDTLSNSNKSPKRLYIPI